MVPLSSYVEFILYLLLNLQICNSVLTEYLSCRTWSIHSVLFLKEIFSLILKKSLQSQLYLLLQLDTW